MTMFQTHLISSLRRKLILRHLAAYDVIDMKTYVGTELQSQGTFTYGLKTKVPPSTRSHRNGSKSANDYAKQLL